jgi:hypothetical protein
VVVTQAKQWLDMGTKTLLDSHLARQRAALRPAGWWRRGVGPSASGQAKAEGEMALPEGLLLKHARRLIERGYPHEVLPRRSARAPTICAASWSSGIAIS